MDDAVFSVSLGRTLPTAKQIINKKSSSSTKEEKLGEERKIGGGKTLEPHWASGSTPFPERV
jgi:hypothetical protein